MCPRCKGELKPMLKLLKFENNVTFVNVPVIECEACKDEVVVSFEIGLIIDHYKRNHCKEGETVDFNIVKPLYTELNTLDILALENNHVQ